MDGSVYEISLYPCKHSFVYELELHVPCEVVYQTFCLINFCLQFNLYYQQVHVYQSSTLTTGPKVLASKNWLGLVKIGNLEVRQAYKHFTVNCYTSLNLPPTGEMVISSYVLTRKKQKVLHMVQ